MVGRVIRFIRFRVDNPPLEVTIAFITGYIAFLPAAALGVSGVLAVVTAGVYMGWYTPELTTVDTRLQGDDGCPAVACGPQRRPLVLVPGRVERGTRACELFALDRPLVLQDGQCDHTPGPPGADGERQFLPAAARSLGEPVETVPEGGSPPGEPRPGHVELRLFCILL